VDSRRWRLCCRGSFSTHRSQTCVRDRWLGRSPRDCAEGPEGPAGAPAGVLSCSGRCQVRCTVVCSPASSIGCRVHRRRRRVASTRPRPRCSPPAARPLSRPGRCGSSSTPSTSRTRPTLSSAADEPCQECGPQSEAPRSRVVGRTARCARRRCARMAA